MPRSRATCDWVTPSCSTSATASARNCGVYVRLFFLAMWPPPMLSRWSTRSGQGHSSTSSGRSPPRQMGLEELLGELSAPIQRMSSERLLIKRMVRVSAERHRDVFQGGEQRVIRFGHGVERERTFHGDLRGTGSTRHNPPPETAHGRLGRRSAPRPTVQARDAFGSAPNSILQRRGAHHTAGPFAKLPPRWTEAFALFRIRASRIPLNASSTTDGLASYTKCVARVGRVSASVHISKFATTGHPIHGEALRFDTLRRRPTKAVDFWLLARASSYQPKHRV
jgi:hypothetical protein